MRNHEGRIELQKTVQKRKMICCFKSNMCMFFYQISRIFSRYLTMISLFFILFSFLQWNLHTQCIFNQNTNRTKWFAILESQFYRQSRAFLDYKKILVSILNTTGGILCGAIMSERSKIRKYPAISYWLASISKKVMLF